MRSVWWFGLLVLCLSGTGCIKKEAVCGDGIWDQGEDCDDGNRESGDLCTSSCDFPEISQLALGENHTCALIENGSVRCWGLGASGQLGYANTQNIGDDETPAQAGDVNVGGVVTEITAGDNHTCALLENGSVRCWGLGASGQLGYANTQNIGDNETPAQAGDVNVGGAVTEIVAGANHTCALLSETDEIRCWGLGSSGQLGYANTQNIGDNETPASVNKFSFDRGIREIVAGGNHTCAVSYYGTLRCWGLGASGQLGYGNTQNIGDNEAFDKVEPLEGVYQYVFGALRGIEHISLGGNHTCIRFGLGAVRCWGLGSSGQLGYGNTNNIGDDELPSKAGALNIGTDSLIKLINAGGSHTCATMSRGKVRCWGLGASGQLGYGNTQNIGDDETPAAAGDVPLLSRERTTRPSAKAP
jgi:cysteine-rich repeat protein